MSNNTENNHIYYVDPGIGTKSPSCPYTHHEDGRDVFSYVYPPKGYELIGFKLEPYESDKFYDGKIVAQYEKKTFSDKLSENLGMYIRAAIAFIGVLAVLAFYVFDFPRKPSPTQQAKPSASSFIVDTPVQEQVSDTPINSENTLIVEDVKENVIDEVPETEEVIAEEPEEEEEPAEEELPEEQQTPSKKKSHKKRLHPSRKPLNPKKKQLLKSQNQSRLQHKRNNRRKY